MYIVILLIIIFTALIRYLIYKKCKNKITKKQLVINILWLEACAFVMAYLVTNNETYKVIWFAFMFSASMVTLIKKR